MAANDCKYCGTPLIEGDRFCRACGATIEIEPEPASNPRNYAQTEKTIPANQSKGKGTPVPTVSAAGNKSSGCLKLIVVILVVMLLVGFFGGSQESSSTASSSSSASVVAKTPKLITSLTDAGYTQDEAQAFFDVIQACGLDESVEKDTIDVVENGGMTIVRIKGDAGLTQINATAEDHVLFYVEWTRSGLSSKDHVSVVMYDMDTVEGGFKNYYDKKTNAFMAWALRPGA